ncbi:MAG: dihydroorotate dehydrogenase-like protein [Marinifilaceae bacterium]|jgi:dihydroorotate dehydrogenase (fumarate)|nr:dihydroorotate dehydrogenase-like protein [Marinifilaceae bacterium]
MPDLTTNYLGLKMPSPIIVASSGLTDNIEKLIELEQNGAGAVVLKSLFEEEILMEMEQTYLDMTSRPYIYPENFDYKDSEFKEDGIRAYLSLIQEAKSRLQIPVIASINCISEQKWIYFATEIEKAGADALEVNLFVPPTNLNNSAADNEKVYFDVLDALKNETSLPIALKISHYHSSLSNMIVNLDRKQVDGLVLFNRYFSPDIDIHNLSVINANSLSTPDDYINTLRWIGFMSGKINCSLSATTGIHSSDSIIKQLLAGADTVQIASVLYKHGTEYIDILNKEITAWMENNKFKTIDDFKGMLKHTDSEDMAIYERTQYMKQFRNFVM